jgi:hypothetical protein
MMGLEELLKGLAASGPLALLLFYIFNLERQDRLKKEARNEALVERIFGIAEETRDALKDLNGLLDGSGKGIK